MKNVLSIFLMLMCISFAASSQDDIVNIYCGQAKVFEKDDDQGCYTTYPYSLISLNPSQFVVLYSDIDFHNNPVCRGLVAEKGINFVREWGDDQYLFSTSSVIIVNSNNPDDEPLKINIYEVVSFKDGICYIKEAFTEEPDIDGSYIEIMLAPGQEQEIKSLLDRAINTIKREQVVVEPLQEVAPPPTYLEMNPAEEYMPEEPKPEPKSNSDEVFKSAVTMPSFPGGNGALMNYINQNIRYPQAAQDNNIQGKVVVQF
ncbi:MAG: hypothetical protein IKX31_02115, partial [Muribaculaceae bacterium]|nr:hypothetical protein [Muribaculaceae bacterium]